MRWVGSEQEARRQLKPQLREYLNLARVAHELVERAISTLKQQPLDLPAQVQAIILVRMSNDVRLVEIASYSGYTMQALCLAATVYELAAAFAFIGTDQGRAQEWQKHLDPRHSFPPSADRRKAIRLLLSQLGVEDGDLDDRTSDHELLYQRFCMAKHGNPEMLRAFGAKVTPSMLKLYHGPFSGPGLVWYARFVLFHTVKLLAACAFLLVKCRQGSLQESRLKPFLRRAAPMMNQLMEAGRNVDLALKTTSAG